MEFRDYLAAVTAVVAIASLMTTWLKQRGWERDRFARDELAEFVKNTTVAEHVKPDVVRAAKEAELVLSLELAERARKLAAKKAISASAMGRRIAFAGAGTGAAVTVLQFAAYNGTSDDSFGFWGGLIYFSVASAVVIAAFVLFVLEQRRIRASTGNLRDLRKRVTQQKPLGQQDIRTPR